MSFDTLGLSQKVLDAIVASGYTTPTPIQEQSIPHVIQGRDVLGIAQTGTGKTASFTLPMLTRLERGRARARMPRTLIMEPTRELAAQVFETFERYGANHKLTVALLIGGVSFVEQDKKLTRGADVLIATPGRLLDHFERGKLLLTGTEIFVIDEADRMLDMGFIPDIERIAKLLPPRHQTLFFSATMPPEITRLAGAFLKDPVRVEVARQATTAENVAQFQIDVNSTEGKVKREKLRNHIQSEGEAIANAIIFCNRKRDVGVVYRSLKRHGFDAGELHGDMDQHTRTATLDGFRSGNLRILVASDVAARGLDIPAVSHVYNFDVPTHSEDYVHRIGRTGRAGRSGMSVTLVTRQDRKYIDSIVKLIGKPIPNIGESVSKPAQEPKINEFVAESQQEVSAKVTEKPKRSRSRRRRGRPEESNESGIAVEAGQNELAKAVTAESIGQTSEKAKPSDSNRKTGRVRSKPVPFGSSEFVPAFLLRPVKLSERRESSTNP